MWIDAHAHLSSSKIQDHLESWIHDCKSAGIHQWILGGVDPRDWLKQKELYQKYPKNFGLSFGLHPWFVAQNSKELCNQALETLKKELSQKPKGLVALGETGLDFHENLPSESHAEQERFFIEQIRLARDHELPLILHILKAHDRALEILKKEAPIYKGIIHSYSGDEVQANQYIELGFQISFSYSVLSREKRDPKKPGKAFDRLKRIVVSLESTDFVLETDSPDQPPVGQEINHPLNLIELAKTVGQLRQEDWKSVLDQSTQNLKKIFYGNS